MKSASSGSNYSDDVQLGAKAVLGGALRRVAMVSALLLLCLAGSGCNYMLEMGGRLFTKTPKTTPAYTFTGEKLVVVVEMADPTLERELPRLGYDINQAIVTELDRMQATGGLISPRVVNGLRLRPGYHRMSPGEIGAALGADKVLYVVVHRFAMESAMMADHYQAEATLGMRVFDVTTDGQVWPAHGMEHHLEARTPTGIIAESQSKAMQKIIDGIGQKAGLLFAVYEVDKLPLRPDVQ